MLHNLQLPNIQHLAQTVRYKRLNIDLSVPGISIQLELCSLLDAPSYLPKPIPSDNASGGPNADQGLLNQNGMLM
jgi:hypothetical protein